MVHAGAWFALVLRAKCLCTGYQKKSLKNIGTAKRRLKGVGYAIKSLERRRRRRKSKSKYVGYVKRKRLSKGIGYLKKLRNNCRLRKEVIQKRLGYVNKSFKKRRIRHDGSLWCVGGLFLKRLSVVWCLGAWCILVLVLAWCAALHQHQD